VEFAPQPAKSQRKLIMSVTEITETRQYLTFKLAD